MQTAPTNVSNLYKKDMSSYKIGVRSNITNIVQIAIGKGIGILRLLWLSRAGAIAVESAAERCTIRSDFTGKRTIGPSTSTIMSIATIAIEIPFLADEIDRPLQKLSFRPNRSGLSGAFSQRSNRQTATDCYTARII